MRSVYLSPFHREIRQSGVSLESPGLENIPEVPANLAKVAQNHDARKAESWAIIRPRSSTPSMRSFCLCPFHSKIRVSGVSLESLGLENIPPVPANRPKVAEHHDARKAFSAILSVLK